MEDKVLIAKRVAQELHNGDLVNLGIGMPTLVANYVPANIEVYFQSENGIIGMSAVPGEGLEDEQLTDAGGIFVGALPGACSLDSCTSFALIRGGHLDLTVLGGLQIDEQGVLANWMIPGKMVPGMGGGMDLATGAKKVIVSMTHAGKGGSKIVKKCTLPITSARRADLIVTELAVIEPTDQGLVLKERGPGVTVEQIIAATEAKLIVPANVPEMAIA
jgi:acetate CoA/acetoacetate CoA-transferase beta subunit